MHADIPLPPDAVSDIEEWRLWNGSYSRQYIAWSHAEGHLRVEVYGTQNADGRVERHIVMEWPDAGVSAAQARRGAAAVLNAADEVDRVGAVS